MKRHQFGILPLAGVLLALAAGALSADPPKKQPLGRYAPLWTNSPFTVKPVKEAAEEVPSVLEDYVLTGVSHLPEGYFVVLMNKKKREERVRIAPGEQNAQGFQVVSVKQDPYDFNLTEVEIQVRGGKSGKVGYDEKYLALKGPAAARKPTGVKKPTPRKPPIPGLNTGKKPTSSGNKPRVRRVPTPPKR